LGAFVEENHKLLSALAIFTALTVFARALPIRILGDLLSFLFLAATVILWFELQEHYPPQTSSAKLQLFESVVSAAVLVLIGCWLILYWAFWRPLLVVVIFLILSFTATTLFQKYDLFNRLFRVKAGNHRILRRVVYFATVALMLLTTLVLATMLGIKVTPFLEQMHTQLQENVR
jgi:hypothetical protein